MRIYTLAKELKLDSKVLVDLLNRAGIVGKGSALASLTDEELARLRAYMAKEAGASTAAAAKPAPATAGPAVKAAAPVNEGAIRREDYVAPTGAGGRPPAISAKPERPPMVKAPAAEKDSETGDRPESPRKSSERPAARGPVVRVAMMPTSAQPTPPPKANEPEPQKPDIRLPLDVIRATRAAAGPLQAQVKKHQDSKKGDAGSAPSTPSTPAGGDRGGKRPGAPAAGGAGRGAGRNPALQQILDQVEQRDKDKKKEKARDEESRIAAAGSKKGKAPGELLLGGRETRQANRLRSKTGQAEPPKRVNLGDDDQPRYRGRPKPRKGVQNTAAPRKGHVVVQIPCTVRSFSEAIGVRAPQVLAKLMTLGKMVNINAEIDPETVQLLAVEFNVEIELKHVIDAEQQMFEAMEKIDDSPESLVQRAPIVTFLGHVDHGKTSLLDRIIGINVAAGESGGITQHIRAYRVDKDGRAIAFVDTPGHEAFTEMRARGANVTDIAVLVVAGDDGVMPQTEEAINHAKAAEVPIVVALNKADLPGIDRTRILQQLATAGLLATEWGGDVEVVATSALKGTGIDDLLETILTIAELHEYKANADRAASGTCLEAELHEGRGVVAKVMVQNGTLKVGDVVVCGPAYGRIKAMYDTLKPRETYQEAGPATPVNVTGLDVPPGAGDHFYVLSDIAQARLIAEKRQSQSRFKSLGGPVHTTFENLHERLSGEKVEMLNVILRADVRGSIEAILKELEKLQHDEVQIKVLQAMVGGVTEADVHLADASDAIIIGFNVVPDDKARSLADERGVQIRRYDIIYQVTDDLRKALEGMLEPEKREIDSGRALVQRVFTISRVGAVAGCRVLSGTIDRNSRCRIIRDSRVIGDYAIDSLKREKDDSREVREGLECGIKLAGFNDLKEGDLLEAYKVEEFARTL